MYQRGARGVAPLAIVVLSAIAAISSVIPIEGQEVRRLPQAYVNGVLNLKGSLLSKRPAVGYGYGHAESAKSPNQQLAPPARVGADMRYTPQLQDPGPVQKQSKIQVENVANLRPSRLAYRPLLHSQMPSSPSVQLRRYSKEFPAPHLFQPPFAPLPVPKSKGSQAQKPTAEQLELLQQLSEFFDQRQRTQRPRLQPGKNLAQTDQSDGQDTCDSEATTDTPETTKEPKKGEEEGSVTVIIKTGETTKSSAAPETTTAKPTKPTKTTKSTTKRPTKSTTKYLPCCTKSSNRNVAEVPNELPNLALNVQNDQKDESKTLQQQPRSSRHVIHPELRIRAIEDYLRYRDKSGNEQLRPRRVLSKQAHSAAPSPSSVSDSKDQGLQLNSRAKRHNDDKTKDDQLLPRPVLSKQQLYEAEAKLWSDVLRYRQKRAPSAVPSPSPISNLKDQGLQLGNPVKGHEDKPASEELRPRPVLSKEQLYEAEAMLWADVLRYRKKRAPSPSPNSNLMSLGLQLSSRAKKHEDKPANELLRPHQVLSKQKLLEAEGRLWPDRQKRVHSAAPNLGPKSDLKDQGRVKKHNAKAADEQLRPRPVLSKEKLYEAEVELWSDVLKYRQKRAHSATPYLGPTSDLQNQGLQLVSRGKRHEDEAKDKQLRPRQVLDKKDLLKAEVEV